ncbi:rhomboid family intramembrane serine protease [Lacticaseibacillus daqingensis]|uniref:rhomboid family intramembrane serine protease n=1 Tax=Lacticaseibacillus daqingensis TaxID=2486014 RepID=UPI000F7A3477|nr:rhomboid family intramembrane serine protease [Lacticaseibacillus daqingensis]
MHNPYWRTRYENIPFVTYALLGVTVIMFLIETLAGGSTNSYVLLQLGARYNPAIYAGQWWRFFTPMFLHIGVMHLAVNAVSLYFLGEITEKIFGHWRFLAIYLVSGVAGNVASFVFNPEALAAGASTAIFGLMGAFLMLGDTYRHNGVIMQLSRQFLTMAVLNLFFNLFSGGVDIFGHIGGLIGGVLIAGLVGAPKLGPMPRAKQAVAGILLVVALVALLHVGMMRVG